MTLAFSLFLIATQVLLAMFAFGILHELGHVIVARALKDPTARFVMIGKLREEWIIATTFTSFAKIEDWRGVVVAFSGVIFTRILSDLILFPLFIHFRHTSIAVFFITLYTLARTDLWFYTVRDTLTTVILRRPQRGADVSEGLEGIRKLIGGKLLVYYMFLLLFATIDFLAFWRNFPSLLIGISR